MSAASLYTSSMCLTNSCLMNLKNYETGPKPLSRPPYSITLMSQLIRWIGQKIALISKKLYLFS